jgi:hypothetical protein
MNLKEWLTPGLAAHFLNLPSEKWKVTLEIAQFQPAVPSAADPHKPNRT